MLQSRVSFRAVLLFSLAPILLFCGWVAKQDMFYPVYFVTASADGRYLLSVHTRSYYAPVSDPVVRLWDLRTGRLLRQLRYDTEIAAFSTDGRTIAIGGFGSISFRNSETFAEFRKIETQGNVHPLQFTQDDQHLLLSLKTPAYNLQLVHVATGEISDNWDTRNQAPARTGRDLFVDDFPEVRVVQFKDGKFVQRASRTFSALPNSYVVTPDGSQVAALYYDQGRVEIWRPANDDVVEITLGAAPVSFFIQFLDHGRLLAAYNNGGVTIWDWREQRQVGGWKTSNHLLPVQSPHQEKTTLAYSLELPLTIYDLSNGNIIATLPMRLTTYFVWVGIAAVAFVTWTILWFRTGMRSERRWPTLDLAIVHGAVMLLLLVRFLFAESRQDIERPIVVIAWSEFIAVLSLVGWWFCNGTNRWPVRTAGVIGMIAVISALIATSWRGEGYVVWQAAIGMFAAGFCLAVGFKILKGRGISLQRIGDDNSIPSPIRKSQVTMRDLFLLATAAAAFFAAARFFKPVQVHSWVLLFIGFNAVTYAIAATTAVWAALSDRSLILRAILFVGLTGIAGWLPTEVFRKAPLLIQPTWWYLTAHVLMATVMWGTFVVFRAYGRVATKGT